MKPTREEALAIAAERKAARRQRTSRIRKLVATLAVAAFIGPFAVIYTNVASGKDPALSTVVASTASGASTTSETATTDSSGSASTSAATTSPAPVTTQQS